MQQVTVISESDVKDNAGFERDGHWFRVHFVRDGEVYFAHGKSGKKVGFEAIRMPIAEFVKQYNKGISKGEV